MGMHSTSRDACRSNNVDVRLVLSWTQPGFHLMDYRAKPECQVLIEDAILEVQRQCGPENVLVMLGGKYPQVHIVTCHYTLAVITSMADVDSLFSGQIPTKILIGLVINKAFVKAWWKKLPLPGPELGLPGGGELATVGSALQSLDFERGM